MKSLSYEQKSQTIDLQTNSFEINFKSLPTIHLYAVSFQPAIQKYDII